MPLRMPALRSLALLIVALGSTGSATVAEPASTAPKPADLQADARLRVPVRVTCEGGSLRRAIERLGSAASVPLWVEGRAGDERLIAFAEERPAAEVLRAVAELYRLEWCADGEGYVLRKAPAAARDETAAHTARLQEALEPVRARFRSAESAPGGGITRIRLAAGEAVPFGIGSRELFRALRPLVEPELPRLLTAGYLYQPVGSLPLSRRNALVPRLQIWLNGEDRARESLNRWLRNRYPTGSRLTAPIVRVTPGAADCTLLVELERGQPFGVSVGLGVPGREPVTWFNASLSRLADDGASLYPGTVRPPNVQPPDPLARPIRLDPAREGEEPWLAALRTVAKRTGIPVYGDWYTHVKSVGSRREETVTRVQGVYPAAALLDRLCGSTPAAPGAAAEPGHSFWWRSGSAVLVRSGSWLWDSEAVLPAALTHGLARSVRATGRLAPSDLSALAALSAQQVYGAQSSPNRLDGWRAGLVIPASLGLTARRQLVTGGIAWATLSPVDRQQVLRALHPEERTSVESYTASVEVAQSLADDGTPTVELDINARLGGRTLFSTIAIPLPDEGPAPQVSRTAE